MSDQQAPSCHHRKPHRCEAPAAYKIIFHGGVTFFCEQHTKEVVEERPEDIKKVFELATGKEVTAEFKTPTPT